MIGPDAILGHKTIDFEEDGDDEAVEPRKRKLHPYPRVFDAAVLEYTLSLTVFIRNPRLVDY